MTAQAAPTLLIHGDKDELVPISHSKNIHEAFQKAGVKSKLIVIEGAAHGFSPKQTSETVLPQTLAWFQRYLGGKD